MCTRRTAAELVEWHASGVDVWVTVALGEALMGPKMLVMAVISPVMVATIVAGVVLAAHRTRYDRFGDDLKRRTPDDPQPGGVGR